MDVEQRVRWMCRYIGLGPEQAQQVERELSEARGSLVRPFLTSESGGLGKEKGAE